MLVLQFALPILLIAFALCPAVGWLVIRDPYDYWLCLLAGFLVLGGLTGAVMMLWFVWAALWSLAGIIVEQGWM